MDEEEIGTESATMAFLYVKIQSIICNKSCWVIQKTGLGGMAANKGACGIRCLFGTTSFCLCYMSFSCWDIGRHRKI